MKSLTVKIHNYNSNSKYYVYYVCSTCVTKEQARAIVYYEVYSSCSRVTW
jgi:hypothetical protein